MNTTIIAEILNDTDRDQQARNEALFNLLYLELKRLAKSMLVRKGNRIEVQPTELVNELYLKLHQCGKIKATNKASFFGLVATSMQHIIASHGRKIHAEKRKHLAETFDEDQNGRQALLTDWLIFVDLLDGLGHFSQRQKQVVELKLLAGYNYREISEQLQISESLARLEFKNGQAWILFKMQADSR